MTLICFLLLLPTLVDTARTLGQVAFDTLDLQSRALSGLADMQLRSHRRRQRSSSSSHSYATSSSSQSNIQKRTKRRTQRRRSRSPSSSPLSARSSSPCRHHSRRSGCVLRRKNKLATCAQICQPKSKPTFIEGILQNVAVYHNGTLISTEEAAKEQCIADGTRCIGFVYMKPRLTGPTGYVLAEDGGNESYAVGVAKVKQASSSVPADCDQIVVTSNSYDDQYNGVYSRAGSCFGSTRWLKQGDDSSRFPVGWGVSIYKKADCHWYFGLSPNGCSDGKEETVDSAFLSKESSTCEGDASLLQVSEWKSFLLKGYMKRAPVSVSMECKGSGSNCDESSWPDRDHGLVCGDCKVLVTRFNSHYKTCSKYCETINRTCSGAWEESGDTCNVKHVMACDQTIASSDAICECKDQPTTTTTTTSTTSTTSTDYDYEYERSRGDAHD